MAHSSDSTDFAAGTAENGVGANPRRAAGRFAARADNFADSWGRRYVFQICAMLGVGILGWMAWEVSSIDVLRRDIDVIHRDVAAMQRNTANIETDIEDMKETVHVVDKRLTNVERDIERINVNIANITVILQRLETDRR